MVASHSHLRAQATVNEANETGCRRELSSFISLGALVDKLLSVGLSVQSSTGLRPGVLSFIVLEKVVEFVFLLNFLMFVTPGVCFETYWSRVDLLPHGITTSWGHMTRQLLEIYCREGDFG